MIDIVNKYTGKKINTYQGLVTSFTGGLSGFDLSQTGSTSSSVLYGNTSAFQMYSTFNNVYFNQSLTSDIKVLTLPYSLYKTRIKPNSINLYMDYSLSVPSGVYLINSYRVYDSLKYYQYGLMYLNGNTALTCGYVFYDKGYLVFINNDTLTGFSTISLSSMITNLTYEYEENDVYQQYSLRIPEGKYTSSKLLKNSNTSLTASQAIYNHVYLVDENYNILTGFNLSASELNQTSNLTLRINN